MVADEAGPGGSGFDAVLRRNRLRVKLTQEELAARAAIGVRTVRDLERGRASRPQRTTVELLAAAPGLAARARGARPRPRGARRVPGRRPRPDARRAAATHLVPEDPADRRADRPRRRRGRA